MEIESVTSASIKGEFFNRIGSHPTFATGCLKVGEGPSPSAKSTQSRQLRQHF
jgi:hypothetical protein